MDEKKLNEVALSYIGTPHINGGNIKGAGLDCCTLPAQIIKEVDGRDIDIVFDYSCDWFCARECKEILLPYLQNYFDEVEKLQAGDLISYRWGRAKYAHLSVYLGTSIVIHCSADTGVEITEMDNPYFFDGKGESRITGFWRLKK